MLESALTRLFCGTNPEAMIQSNGGTIVRIWCLLRLLPVTVGTAHAHVPCSFKSKCSPGALTPTRDSASNINTCQCRYDTS